MIRLATLADARAIAEIYNENLEERGFANCDLNRDSAEVRAKSLAASDARHPTFVQVGANDQVVGWASLKPFSTRPSWGAVAEIALYVTRSARSRVVGAQLLVQLIDAGRACRFTSLIAIVVGKNTASLRGLSVAGFMEVARLRDAIFLHGEWIDSVWVQKALDQPDLPMHAHYITRFRVTTNASEPARATTAAQLAMAEEAPASTT